MTRTVVILTIGAALLLPVAPAFAQGAATTYVSSTGDDENDCLTPATSCEGFGRANDQTMVGGTVLVLDSDSYRSGAITKSLNIIAQGAAAVIQFSASGGPNFAALSINTAAGDVVTIRGVTLGGNSNSYAGVNFLGAGALHLQDCAIHDNRSGIDFTPSGAGELYVTNCTISDNGMTVGAGILIRPSGSGSARVVFDNVRVENNRVGVVVDRSVTTGVVNALVGGSVISNSSTGIVSRGAGAVVRLRDTTVTGNGNGLFVASGGAMISHGGNVVAGNSTNGAFTSTVPQQ